MLKVTIPGLYNKHKLNIAFIDYCVKHPDQLIDEVQFTAYGTIPQNVWAGHKNLSRGNVILYNDIFNLINSYNARNTCCRFDCSNLIINPLDYNVFGKFLLELGNNGSNQIEVSTPEAYDYFTKKFPFYPIVGSEAMIDFAEHMRLIYIVRDESFNDLLPDNYPKNKVEHIILSPCNLCSCEQRSHCILQESIFINNFSEQSKFNTCSKLNSFSFRVVQKYPYRIQIAEYESVVDQLCAYVTTLIKSEYHLIAMGCLSKEIL